MKAGTPHLPLITFDAEDVAVNATGRLTASQELIVQEAAAERRRGRRRAAAQTTIGGVAALAAVGVGAMGSRPSPAVTAYALGVVVLIGVFAVVAGGTFDGDLRTRRVSVAEGCAEVIASTEHWRLMVYRRYELVLRGQAGVTKRFRFGDAAILMRFRPGERYRVYFVDVAGLPILLSAESIAGP